MSERDVQRSPGDRAGGAERPVLPSEPPVLPNGRERLAAERATLEAELAELRSEIEKRKTESKVLAARVAGLRDLCVRLQERTQKARAELVGLTDPEVEMASPPSLGDLEAELIEMGFDIQRVPAKPAAKDGEAPGGR